MITVIGAGKVGGSAALHCAIKQLDDQILLLDIAEGLPQGEAMDLNHLLSEQGIDVEISGSNNYEDMKGSDIVVVVAGAGRKPGMTRMDLLKINAGVVKDVVGNIKKHAEEGMPIYAECGGLMYLTKSISFGKKKYKMVGLFDAETQMTKKMTLNYTEGRITSNCLISSSAKFRAHEFHYSKISNLAKDAKLVYDLKIGEGISGKKDALSEYNTLASYCHLYFDSAKYATKLVSKRV